MAGIAGFEAIATVAFVASEPAIGPTGTPETGATGVAIVGLASGPVVLDDGSSGIGLDEMIGLDFDELIPMGSGVLDDATIPIPKV